MSKNSNRRQWLSVVLTTIVATSSIGLLANQPAPTKKQARYEAEFLTGMIDHHAMAVMMAEMCMERAVHEELRQLCEQIKAAQTQEIATMEAWLEEWYGASYQPQMKRGEEKKMAKLALLSGAQFEIEFMEMMIQHHTKAIREAVQCTNRAYHPELKSMCEDIVMAQWLEIELMQQWLCDWYAICE